MLHILYFNPDHSMMPILAFPNSSHAQTSFSWLTSFNVICINRLNGGSVPFHVNKAFPHDIKEDLIFKNLVILYVPIFILFDAP